MENRKWLKRKYPKSYKEVNHFLNDSQLEEFKHSNFKLGRLIKDANNYKSGDLIMFNKSNPVTSYNYPMHLGIARCANDITESGYHSFGLYDSDFIAVTE